MLWLAAASLGERLSKAGVHTLICMGAVFVVLVILIVVISLFRLVPDDQAREAKKKQEVVKPAPAAPVAAPTAPVVQEEELTDDLALVAVITAAIAASMGTEQTDGFVVRSIRRANKSAWRQG